MKRILPLLFVLVCATAFGQDTDKKKPKRLRLTGFEVGYSNFYFYDLGLESRSTGITSGNYRGLVPDDSPFWAYFGDNSSGGEQLVYSQDRMWLNQSQQVDIQTIWGFTKKNGDIRLAHQLRFGLGYTDRYYNGNSFGKVLYHDTDTLGITMINNDTIFDLTDTIASVSSSIGSSVKMGVISLGYTYRLFPEEKLSLSFGLGVDLGIGVVTTTGSVSGYSRRTYYGESPYTYPPQGNHWHYYDNGSTEQQSTNLGIIEEKRFKAFMARPYVSARLDYRINRKLPILRNLNAFVEARYGAEVSNIGNKVLGGSPLYYGFRIGFTYYFKRS